MRRVIACAALLVAAIGALPVPAPAQSGTDDLDPRFRAVLNAIERELRDGRDARALRLVRQGIDDLIRSGPASTDPAAIARLLYQQAVAAASRRLPDTAAWAWSLAQGLDPTLAEEDLRRWGEAGDFLAARPLRPQARDGDLAIPGGRPFRGVTNLFEAPASVEIRLPDEQDTPEPDYPPALRGTGIRGAVLLQVRVDRRGHTAEPLILDSPHPILTLAAAETVANWRYRPAQVGGDNVEVYYTVRIDFRPL